MLFNIYISEIPDTVSIQYGYADDLALLFSHKCWSQVEDVLSLDMQRIAEYLSAWRLRLSTAKTTCTAFHLNNRESSRKLAVTVNGTIPYTQNPAYLGVTLDRQLTFRQHLEGLCCKVKASKCLLRLLAGSTWGAHASVLRTSALGLVYTAAEYAAPAWCRSIHTKKLDVALNDTLRIISGCLKPTRRELLPVLSGNPPAHLHRDHSTLKLALQAQLNTNHPLHTLSIVHSFLAHSACIHDAPFCRHAAVLIKSGFNILESLRAAWESATPPAQFLVTPAVCLPSGSELPRSLWEALNRLRTGVGRFGKCLYRWSILDTPKCICGAEEQSANHLTFFHPTFLFDRFKCLMLFTNLHFSSIIQHSCMEKKCSGCL